MNAFPFPTSGSSFASAQPSLPSMSYSLRCPGYSGRTSMVGSTLAGLCCSPGSSSLPPSTAPASPRSSTRSTDMNPCLWSSGLPLEMYVISSSNCHLHIALFPFACSRVLYTVWKDVLNIALCVLPVRRIYQKMVTAMAHFVSRYSFTCVNGIAILCGNLSHWHY